MTFFIARNTASFSTVMCNNANTEIAKNERAYCLLGNSNTQNFQNKFIFGFLIMWKGSVSLLFES